ncbi:MAG TPA: hypothetical protein VJQ45_03015 [Ktedonobacterales bacterium]|nr:hypothetical protein [Ktedonobacterales bacterium]
MAIYYPYRASASNAIHISGGGPFPVLLYAHAYRSPADASQTPDHPPSRDFTEVGFMLSHVVSYGCVCVVPDLSWLSVGTRTDFDDRAAVLAACYEYLLDALNASLFANQLDLSRVVLVGHSTGAGGATHAGRILAGYSHVHSLSYGLVAPVFSCDCGPDTRNLVVMGSSWDVDEDANPRDAYAHAGRPETLIMLPGASHFGYLDNLCPSDNSCGRALVEDVDGKISRDAQQNTAAAYLASLVRYYALGDTTQIPYLAGQRIVEGLDALGVSGIQVQSNGVTLRPTPGPNQ